MCWVGRCDVKIAKRDFYVYKIGRVSDKGFNSLYQNFIYIPGVLNEKVKIRPIIYNYSIHKLLEEQYGVIYEGYHSYKDISLPFNRIGFSFRFILLGNIMERIGLYNDYYIATFIIPKGSIYFVNPLGVIVSSRIKYTGKYIKL